VIIIIDIAAKKVIGSMPTIAYAQGLSLTARWSRMLWVTSSVAPKPTSSTRLSNTASFRLNIPPAPTFAFNSTGTRAYITADGNPGTVVVVDTATFKTLKTYTVGRTRRHHDVLRRQFLVSDNDDGGSVSVILVKDSVSTTAIGAHRAALRCALDDSIRARPHPSGRRKKVVLQ